MESVANQALEAAGLSMSDIDAVAATVKPGNQCFLVTIGIKSQKKFLYLLTLFPYLTFFMLH